LLLFDWMFVVESLQVLRSPAVSANLLLVAASCEVAHAHCSPPKLRHQFGQTPVCAGCAVALRHLKHVQHGLAADALLAIKLDLAADTLQRRQPEILGSSTSYLSPFDLAAEAR
jgi:hypothetical protein